MEETFNGSETISECRFLLLDPVDLEPNLDRRKIVMSVVSLWSRQGFSVNLYCRLLWKKLQFLPVTSTRIFLKRI